LKRCCQSTTVWGSPWLD